MEPSVGSLTTKNRYPASTLTTCFCNVPITRHCRNNYCLSSFERTYSFARLYGQFEIKKLLLTRTAILCTGNIILSLVRIYPGHGQSSDARDHELAQKAEKGSDKPEKGSQAAVPRCPYQIRNHAGLGFIDWFTTFLSSGWIYSLTLDSEFIP